MKPHIGIDTEVSLSKHEDIGNLLSAHGDGVVWTRMLAAGDFTSKVDHIEDNMIAS